MSIEVKRLIGRNFNDANVQRDIGLWPFRVINEQGRPKIAVNHQGMEKTFYPEEISSMVLARLKDEATKFLGSPVREAVITVPAYFSDSQRQATKDAGTIAGLNVLRIINEPTAGALAYGLGDTDGDERNVLIFDFGGGTFDVSVLTIEEGIFEVRSTAGDTHLGGCDLDSRLVEHFADEFERRHGRSVRGSPKVMQRLRTACERVKRMLSSASETSLQLDALHAGIDFQVTVTRARFDNLCADLFQATLEPVRKAMSDAKLNKSDISDVVLVGGSTRIPAVQKMLRDFFDGKELDHTVNPDEAVAAGAAIQAAALSGDLSQTVMDLVLVDVTPLSLGTAVHGGMNSIIIPRNTTIPTRKTGEYSTVRDFQTSILVKIQEGERTMSKDTNVLGEFNLTGITRAPAGVPKLEITYEIDADGILHATAVDKTSGKSNSITITNDKGRLSQREIERLVKEAENWKQDDEKKKEAALAKNDLERFCYETKKKVQRLGRDTENTEKIFQRIEETLAWIQTATDATKADVERKKREVELTFDLIFLKL